jgi:hypothetical protein
MTSSVEERASTAPVAGRRDAQSGLGVLMRLLGVPVFGFLTFFVFLAAGLPWDRVPLLAITIALATLIFTVIAVDRTRPRERRSLLFSIFSFSYSAFFVVPSFVFYLAASVYDPAESPNPVPLTPNDVAWGMLAAAVAYLMVLVGFSLPIGSGAANMMPRMRREWSATTGVGVALIMIPLGWAVLLASQLGLIPARAGSGFLGTFVHGATFGIGLLALVWERYRSRAALFLLCVVVPGTMFFNFFTSSKGAFLRPIVMVVIVRIIVTRRIRMSWVLGFIAAAALIYPVSMAYREYMSGNRLSALQVIANPNTALRLVAGVATTADPAEYMKAGLQSTARRLNGLGILSAIVRDAGTRVPFQHGWSIGYIPLSYIPRVLWKDKPRFETGIWVTDNFGYPGIDTSTGSTWIGEFFFNFGWAGVIIGMALLGIWFRFLQDMFLRMDSTIPAMLAGIVTIMVIGPAIEGDLLAPTNGVIFLLTPLLLMHWLVTKTMPPPARLPPPL